MFRTIGAAAVLVITSIAALGCDSGFSPEDATVRCDQEKAVKGTLFGRETYKECLSCFETCGNECAAAASSPPSYKCPEGSEEAPDPG